MYMQQPYDPSKQYFMLDYTQVEDCSWIRMPYLTLEEVSTRIEWLNYQGIEIKDLRVLPEAYLDQKREAEYEAGKGYKEDSITNRQYFFDDRYEGMSQRYKERSLVVA